MSRLPFFILSFKVILPLPNHRFEELGSETTRSVRVARRSPPIPATLAGSYPASQIPDLNWKPSVYKTDALAT